MDSKGALAELKSFQGTRKGAGDYYSDAQNELGVGTAQARSNDLLGLVRNTEKQLQGVGESVAGRTRGNLVTEAQRARLQNLETAPIAQQLGGLQTAYGDSQTNYRDLLGQAGTRAGLSYQTDQDKVAGLQSQYDRLFGQEQSVQEQDRWNIQQAASDRQFEEMVRQFNESQNTTKSQYAQTLAEQRAQRASQASLSERSQKAVEEQERREALQAETLKHQVAQAKADSEYEKHLNRAGGPNDFGSNLSNWWNSLPTSGIFR